MTIFEKIWSSLGVINILLFVIGIVNVSVDGTLNEPFNFHLLGSVLMAPMLFQLGITLFLLIIDEVILCKIWKLDLHVFPSLFGEDQDD